MPSMAPAKKALPAPKIPTVNDHKLDEYRRMGFTIKQSKELLQIHGLYAADVREKFISKGCTPKLAFDILKP